MDSAQVRTSMAVSALPFLNQPLICHDRFGTHAKERVCTEKGGRFLQRSRPLFPPQPKCRSVPPLP
jgi:hypothetical protein